jgi:hypothetical protein
MITKTLLIAFLGSVLSSMSKNKYDFDWPLLRVTKTINRKNIKISSSTDDQQTL